MSLPIRPLPTDSIEVNGEPVEYRSLSRSEAMRVTTDFAGNADGAEVFIIARGTGVSEADAIAWRDVTDMTEAGQLVDAILYLTGLAKRPTDGGRAADPKASGNEP